MKTEKRYDMRKQEWREGNFKRGDTWKSTRKFKCYVCGERSDEWVMGGWPGMGPRLVCPLFMKNSKFHDEIQEKVWKWREPGHPKIYIEALWSEIREMGKKLRKIYEQHE